MRILKQPFALIAFAGALLSFHAERASAQEAQNPAPQITPSPTPAAQADPEPIGQFRNTWYFLADERDYPGRKTVAVRTLGGTLLAKVTTVFKRHLDMEGSGKLADGRVLNYRGKVGNSSRFDFTRHEFGRGAGNCSLHPMRSIAVDPTMIPLGSVVKIDETVGIRLPDGTIHDGLWRAEDTGALIQRDHIDIFVGAGEDSGRILADNGIDNQQPLTVRIMQAPTSDSCVYQDPQ